MIHIVKVFVMEGRMDEKQWKGMGLAIMGALFWGLSGTSVQFLESAKHINVEWLLEARLLIAGILPFYWPMYKRESVFSLSLKNRKT